MEVSGVVFFIIYLGRIPKLCGQTTPEQFFGIEPHPVMMFIVIYIVVVGLRYI